MHQREELDTLPTFQHSLLYINAMINVKTRHSCQGHPHEYKKPYISFAWTEQANDFCKAARKAGFVFRKRKRRFVSLTYLHLKLRDDICWGLFKKFVLDYLCEDVNSRRRAI